MRASKSEGAPQATALGKPRLIFVDLDGTLARTDLFAESIFRFLKENPVNIFRLLAWLARGIAHTKDRIADHVDIEPAEVPLEPSLLDYLKEQRDEGRRLVMATAAHRKYAQGLADQLGIFDAVLASEASRNLKGKTKLAAIREAAGNEAFAYAGDHASDRPIWQAAAANIFVNAPAGDVEAAKAAGKLEKTISSQPPGWRAFLTAMRPRQYAKNVLLFVPLFTSHEYLHPAGFLTAFVAFVCFSLCASGVYLLNDLLDLQADRLHPTKRHRPLASGDLGLVAGAVGALALPAAAFALAAILLPGAFVLVLAAYFLTTNAYSFFLKRISTADVMTLAILYTLRVVAGGAATGIVLSSWLLAFSVFVFVSLGFLKRYVEVAALPSGGGNTPGRGYSSADAETMFSLGIANITASVLILTLYINSEEVNSQYRTPEFLWLLCLLMLYWGNRIWVGARRGKIDDDPVVFAIRDRISRMVAAAFVVITLAARYIDV